MGKLKPYALGLGRRMQLVLQLSFWMLDLILESVFTALLTSLSNSIYLSLKVFCPTDSLRV